MNYLKLNLKKLLASTKIKYLVAFIFITAITVNGYLNYEDFVDNEKLELETYVADKDSDTFKSSTTTIPILVYHKIGKIDLLSLSKDHKPYGKFNVQQNVFETQMQFIKAEGYSPLTVQELIQEEKNNTLPNKPIAITFDDGWRSQYDNALPILNKYQMLATFYIYTGVIGSNAYMTWDNLHTLVNSKMEIGDHTKSHPRLTKIDPSHLDEELLQSRITLEKNLHIKITDFAYPYGNYNSSIIENVKKDGYISARTSNKGIYNDFKDLYQLNVIYAPSDLQTLENMLLKS